jgi:hypothetical protein
MVDTEALTEKLFVRKQFKRKLTLFQQRTGGLKPPCVTKYKFLNFKSQKWHRGRDSNPNLPVKTCDQHFFSNSKLGGF